MLPDMPKGILMCMLDDEEIDPQTIKTVFNGFPLSFVVRQCFKDLEFYTKLDINIDAKDGKTETPIASLHLIIVQDAKGVCHATTNISNEDRSVSGLGIAMWENAPEIIQKVSNKLNLAIRHLVRKQPRRGLPLTKWDKLFLPILEKHGYLAQPLGHLEENWVKWYKPEKK